MFKDHFYLKPTTYANISIKEAIEFAKRKTHFVNIVSQCFLGECADLSTLRTSYLPMKIAAAAATAIAGILHLSLAHPFHGSLQNIGIFFLVAGIAQIFWIIPVVRNWHRGWYYAGIGGTIVLIAMLVITRMPGNPITGRGFPTNATAIAVEVFEVAFIGLAAAIIVYETRMKRLDRKSATGAAMNKNRVLMLAGIVVAAILVGLFVPISLDRAIGPPPQGFGPPPQFGTPQQSTTQRTGAATNLSCKLTPSLIEVERTPQQTEGPYFVDEMLNRSDIRSDPSDGSVQDGIPLRLVIHVYDADHGSCIPLSRAHVDIWHANSQGLYSDIQQSGTVGKKYLRGYQVTDDNGTVRFTTIYPGWYQGRAIHIHIKVRAFEGSEKTFEWTSQLFFNDSITDQVQAQPPYSNHGPRDTTNEEDGIYTGPSTDGMLQKNTGTHLMLNLTKDEQSYLGTFNVVVDTGKFKQ